MFVFIDLFWEEKKNSENRILFKAKIASGAPQQSEICVTFSVFHTVFWREILVKFLRRTSKPWKKCSPKFHAKFHATIGREKRRKLSLPALLQGSCSEKSPRMILRAEGRFCKRAALANVPSFRYYSEKDEGAARLGATGLRGSEREICLWEGLWEGGFQRFSEFFRGF